jgi:TolA-binding protein
MENEFKHLELIEAYLEGTLSQEEKVDFEVRLLVDKELEEELELYKNITGGFRNIKSENIRQQLQAIDEELDNKKNSPTNKFYWWAGIAASLIFLQIYLYNSKSTIPLPIEEGLPVLMGEDQNVEFQNAMQLFKGGKYDASINRFNKLIIMHPDNDTLNYFLGCAELNIQQYLTASKHLEMVDATNSSVFNLKAKYFLAFALYKTNKTKEAKVLLDELNSNSDNPFVEETKAFLKEVNEN